MKTVTISKHLIISALVELANAEMEKRDIMTKSGDSLNAGRHQTNTDAILERVRNMRAARQVIVICE